VSRFCPYNRDVECAATVGSLCDAEVAVQDAFLRATQGEDLNSEDAARVNRYESMADGSYGLEVLGMAAMMLPQDRPCAEFCPIQREIIARQNMQGGAAQ
jgi:hypothetical protein